ncbi:MAG: hypothetical protein GY839_09845 [candidate division Zixibacteria bacterium]|nr:hypothetical protein [candidate division Zixibacteria bacterium]
MVIKKFIAPTMTEALDKVRTELGDQAVILKTRMNRKGGNSGGGKSVEVTAAVERGAKARFEMPENTDVAISEVSQGSESEQETEISHKLPSEKLESLAREIEKFSTILKANTQAKQPQSFFGNFSGNMIDAGRELISRNLSEELAFSIISGMAQAENALKLDKEDIRILAHQALCSMIPNGEPIEMKEIGPTVVMFIGMTGSGKTSAVARVATHHKVEKNDKVAIITTDNFRADSSHQIKSFCRILGCPCGIVYTPEELSMAIKSQPDGLILVDTPGVNPNDAKEIGELLTLIKAAKLHEIQLVVSASTPAKDVEKMLAVFDEIGVDKIFITKLDETEAPGGVVTEVINSGKKLSYICSSREIPGRFAVANSESLADAMTTRKSAETSESKWEMEAVGIWQ